mmetsp:Transcript_48714/g.139303  ORF Transcript_48714/g.139303 Transcript_48714/m.139303 type:complete len:357 (+) Transcript_48714:1671-2741(+)
MPEFAIADHLLARGEGRHLDDPVAVLVVPAVGGETPGLAELHARGLHRHQLVARELGALPGLHRLRAGPLGRRVQRWPGRGHLHEVHGRLPEQHGRGLEVDPLVLKAHEERPHGVVPAHGHGRRAAAILQRRVCGDEMGDGLVDLLPVGVHLGDQGPDHVVLVHVVPQHLVHADLEDGLKVGVHGPVQDPGHAELVDVEARRVAVVEDLWVSQAVHRGPVEGLLAPEARKKGLGQGPAVVEVRLRLLARHASQVWHGERAQAAVGGDAGADAWHRWLARVPVRRPRSLEPLVVDAAEVGHPGLMVAQPRPKSLQNLGGRLRRFLQWRPGRGRGQRASLQRRRLASGEGRVDGRQRS